MRPLNSADRWGQGHSGNISLSQQPIVGIDPVSSSVVVSERSNLKAQARLELDYREKGATYRLQLQLCMLHCVYTVCTTVCVYVK